MSYSGYFKPFRHTPTGKTFSSRGAPPPDPIDILKQEADRLWKNTRSSFPDVVLSIGPGNGYPMTNGKFKFSKEATDNLAWRPAQDSERAGSFNQSAWNKYLDTLPSNFPSSNFIRFDVKMPQILPEKDDIEALRAFQELARSSIRQADIRALSMRLLASLFYFERVGTIDEISDHEFYVYGNYGVFTDDGNLSKLTRICRGDPVPHPQWHGGDTTAGGALGRQEVRHACLRLPGESPDGADVRNPAAIARRHGTVAEVPTAQRPCSAFSTNGRDQCGAATDGGGRVPDQWVSPRSVQG
jgi:hypothetical protein